MKPELHTACWKAVYDHVKRIQAEAVASDTIAPQLLAAPGFLPVRISKMGPRYWPEAKSFPALPDLMPEGWMLAVYKKKADELGEGAALEHFQRCYRRKLHTIGLEKIQAEFERLTLEYLRPIVLLCFETDARECHRGPNGGFAQWWQAKTGEVVTEVEDLSALKPFEGVTA
jgi:hypothetical protein